MSCPLSLSDRQCRLTAPHLRPYLLKPALPKSPLSHLKTLCPLPVAWTENIFTDSSLPHSPSCAICQKNSWLSLQILSRPQPPSGFPPYRPSSMGSVFLVMDCESLALSRFAFPSALCPGISLPRASCSVNCIIYSYSERVVDILGDWFLSSPPWAF